MSVCSLVSSRASIAGLLALLSVAPACLAGQSAAQPPSNYQGPNLFGVCAYVLGDTSYYSNVFSTSGYFKFKAQEAFREYATSAAHGTQIKGSGCRWSTSQEEVTTQKAADKRLLGLPGRSAKGVETGWSFSPGAATNAQTGSAPAPTASTAGRQTANSGTYRNAASSTPNANAGMGSNSGTGSNSGSIASSTQQTMQDSLAASKSSATGAVNDTVATTMGTVSTGASNAIKGLFNHKPKSAATPGAAQPNPPDSGATGSNPAPLGFQNTESPQAVTAETQTIQGLVADVAGADLIINVGTQAGVHPGTKLAVMHAVRTVKDPSSGKVLRTVEDKVGELTIKNADATSAAGTFAGSGAVKVGDTVRSAPE